jgi:DNA-binding LytR/AlgR family response regulator
MKAIILEDEQLAANRLRRMLKEIAPDVKVISTFETIIETANFLLKNPTVDLLFLDIHVADGNSFELFEMVDVKGKVIFTTAYDKYAIKAFRKNAVDYLLKPLKKEQLAEALSKAMPFRIDNTVQESSPYKRRIMIKFMSKIHSLKTDDVAYVFSKNKISYFYTKDNERFASDYKLQDVENMLDPISFFRVNRQFIVHIDSIDQIVKHQASRVKITLKPSLEEMIVISTDKTPLFKRWLEN